MGIKVTNLNIVKPIYDRLTANIIPNGEKLKALPLRSGTRQGCPLSPLLFNIVLESPSYSNQRRKRNKRNPDQKRSELSLFADDMILYIENLRDSITKLLELISEFSKVAGYKIKTQKSLAFLYTNNEKSEMQIKGTKQNMNLR